MAGTNPDDPRTATAARGAADHNFRIAQVWFVIAVFPYPIAALTAVLYGEWSQIQFEPLFDQQSIFTTALVVLGLELAAAFAGMIYLWRSTWGPPPNEVQDTAAEARVVFNRFLTIIGFGVVAAGLLLISVFCYLIVREQLAPTAAELNASMAPAAVTGASPVSPGPGSVYGPPDPSLLTTLGTLPRNYSTRCTKLAMFLIVSCSAAMLGTLFYTATSLRSIRDAHDDPARDTEGFSEHKFWGGLWYRLGESNIFALVLFLLFWMIIGTDVSTLADDGFLAWIPLEYASLPILALFLGMFVTTGERLLFGISKAITHWIERVLPADDGQPSSRQQLQTLTQKIDALSQQPSRPLSASGAQASLNGAAAAGGAAPSATRHRADDPAAAGDGPQPSDPRSGEG